MKIMRKKKSCLYVFYPFLIFLGIKGFLVFNLKKQNLNISFFFSKNFLFLVNYNRLFFKKQSLISSFKSSLQGVNFCFTEKLNLIGIGFRCWTIFSKNKKFLVVKTSLSKDCLFFVPKEIDIFCLNTTTLMIKSLKKKNVQLFVSKLKKLNKFNVYKQKGIFFENESVKLKIGKKM